MKEGDIVKITGAQPPFFNLGDKATLIGQDHAGYWWGNFNKMGNAHVYEEGIWCIDEIGHFEVVPKDALIVLNDAEIEFVASSPKVLQDIAEWHDYKQQLANAIGNLSTEHAERAKVLRDAANKIIAAQGQ